MSLHLCHMFILALALSREHIFQVKQDKQLVNKFLKNRYLRMEDQGRNRMRVQQCVWFQAGQNPCYWPNMKGSKFYFSWTQAAYFPFNISVQLLNPTQQSSKGPSCGFHRWGRAIISKLAGAAFSLAAAKLYPCTLQERLPKKAAFSTGCSCLMGLQRGNRKLEGPSCVIYWQQQAAGTPTATTLMGVSVGKLSHSL